MLTGNSMYCTAQSMQVSVASGLRFASRRVGSVVVPASRLMGLRGDRHGSRSRLGRAPRRFAGRDAQTWPCRAHSLQHALPEGESLARAG